MYVSFLLVVVLIISDLFVISFFLIVFRGFIGILLLLWYGDYGINCWSILLKDFVEVWVLRIFFGDLECM